jgi:G3E family GTPase
MTASLPGGQREKLQHIPANVVMGTSGAAKARLLANWLSWKPPGEHWACLITEADQSLLPRVESAGEVDMASFSGGCICCSGSLELRTVLVQLLRRARPHRVLIEAPAAARSAELLRVLQDNWLAPVIDLRAVSLVTDADRARTLLDNPDADETISLEHIGIVIIDSDAGATSPTDAARLARTAHASGRSSSAKWTSGIAQFEPGWLDLAGPVLAPRFHSGEPPQR